MQGTPGAGPAAGATGNRARDHLANERTFLSWLRTALGVIALAAAVARFGTGGTWGNRVATGALALLGVLILATGTRRYYQVADDLEHDRFTPVRRAPLVVAVAVVVVAAVLLPFLA